MRTVWAAAPEVQAAASTTPNGRMVRSNLSVVMGFVVRLLGRCLGGGR